MVFPNVFEVISISIYNDFDYIEIQQNRKLHNPQENMLNVFFDFFFVISRIDKSKVLIQIHRRIAMKTINH